MATGDGSESTKIWGWGGVKCIFQNLGEGEGGKLVVFHNFFKQNTNKHFKTKILQKRYFREDLLDIFRRNCLQTILGYPFD